MFRRSEYEPDGPPPEIILNANQQYALNEITNATTEGKYRAFLLHGITGSGKTQVYIDAIRRVMALGKTAIVLVPEISLTPQTVRRFKAHFGDEVAVMHSQMSVGERYDAWRMAHQGKVKIVIGPRSAIFAPLENIGLIVVDEEHDSSYKQFDATPRYNARDVALVRASHINAVVYSVRQHHQQRVLQMLFMKNIHCWNFRTVLIMPSFQLLISLIWRKNDAPYMTI